jgi:hypothetical protein
VKVRGPWARLSAPDWRAPVFPPPGFRRRDPACKSSTSPVCSLLRVLTPVGLAPPERPGGQLLWNLGTSPLRLQPPTLAARGWTCTQRGSEGLSGGEPWGKPGGVGEEREPPLWAQRCKASGGAAGLYSPSAFTFTCLCTYVSPALPGLPGLPGRVWESLRGRLEESSRLGRLERAVRPAWESKLPLGYSQLPTAFSQPTAASTAGSLQLQARSLDTSGVEGDGATFVGKSFEATSGNRTRDPANQSFRLTTQHACVPGRKHHSSCLPTALKLSFFVTDWPLTKSGTPGLVPLKLAQVSAASPSGGSEGGPGGRWWPYCLRGHHGRKPAGGSPPVGTQSSHLGSLWNERVPAASRLWAPRAATHLGSLWKEHVPPASRLWTARAAVSVLCGKNCVSVLSSSQPPVAPLSLTLASAKHW